MPHYCCVPKCKQKGTLAATGEKVSFHVFPKDKALKKLWLSKIKRDEDNFFKITKSTRICSLHFLVTDFWPGVASGRKLLKDDSVPSIFQWTQMSILPKEKQTFKSKKNILSSADNPYNMDMQQCSNDTMGRSSTISEPSSSMSELRPFSLDVIIVRGPHDSIHGNKDDSSQCLRNICCAKANEENLNLNEIIQKQKQEISKSDGEITRLMECIAQQNDLIDKLKNDKRKLEETVLYLEKNCS